MIINTQKFCEEKKIYHTGELTSRIINSMQTDGWTVLTSKEARSYRDNGMYELLDQLCDYWHWDPAKIIIETNNRVEHHPRYTIRHIAYDFLSYGICDKLDTIKHKEWTKEKVYGMFIGRANATRIRGLHNHLNYEYKNLGLTSFHQNMSYYVDESSILEYLAQSNQRYQDIINLPSYSDIDELMIPPINESKNILGWDNIYEKIGIELVFETGEVENNLTTSEKIVRPMLYKRPFMVVAGKNWIAHSKVRPPLKFHPVTGHETKEILELIEHFQQIRKPWKFFDKIIDNSYDQSQGIHRVDHIFYILQDLIRTDKIYRILEDCQEDIEYNYRVIVEEVKIQGEIARLQAEHSLEGLITLP